MAPKIVDHETPDAMADFAEAYAKQSIRDHAALRQAVEDGRVEAETV